MAVEIRQLVIRAVVDPPRTAANEGGAMSAHEREQLVTECVEELRKIMKREQMR